MTREETAKIIAIIKEYYPRDMEATNLKARVEAWYLALKDYNYKEIQMAVIAFATQDTKGFAPSVGQVVDKLLQLKDNADLTEMEAWNLIQKAVRNSSYNAEEEYNKLPDTVKKIVGSPAILKEWGKTDIQEFNTVIQSNFMRSYRAKKSSIKQYNALPNNIKKFISDATKMLENKKKEVTE